MSQITLQTLDFSSLGYPSVGEFYLGVDVDGLPKLRRSTDTLILSATSSSYLQYTSLYYSDFSNLINTDSLIPGGIYVISDFRTSHYIQYTDSIGDGTGLGESVNYGSIEPLVVYATGVNTYDRNVKSLTYPDDDITWIHQVNDREYDHFNYPSGVGRGHIIFRRSKDGNSRDYDFRSVVFWRWNDGSGNYNVVRRVDAPNTFDYKVFKAFEEGFGIVKNNEIHSLLEIPNTLGYPYYLDNLIISTQSQAIGNKISQAFGSTIDVSDFSGNDISIISNTKIKSDGSFILNKIGSIFDSTLGTFSFNVGSLINNSYIQSGEGNQFGSIESSTFSIFNSNNIIVTNGISVTDYSNNINPLRSNQTELVNFDSGRIIYSSNFEFNSLLGTYAVTITESDKFVYSTSSSYLTSTASGGFENYLGIGTNNPLKKLNVRNSGILINGNQSEQLISLGSSYSSRFIIDTESSTSEDLIELRNDNGQLLKITTTMSSFNYGSQELEIKSNQISLNADLVSSTFSWNEATNKFLVWDSLTGTVSYRIDSKIVYDVATSSYSANFVNGSNEYYGVSWSSTTYFNLPSLENVVNGKTITLKDESGKASINPIIIQSGSSSIDGSTQSILSIDYGSLTLIKKSNGWWII